MLTLPKISFFYLLFYFRLLTYILIYEKNVSWKQFFAKQSQFLLNELLILFCSSLIFLCFFFYQIHHTAMITHWFLRHAQIHGHFRNIKNILISAFIFVHYKCWNTALCSMIFARLLAEYLRVLILKFHNKDLSLLYST